ncbi:mid1-interacting protein 1-like [Aethina tumida]|uniref:mid1-interacting protein 1-like n=1 Tax=Aethina tumida TaxID=116153 RepID=UPI00096AF573|nr:mid1-interacting protein 1-like [Aethina tumida]
MLLLGENGHSNNMNTYPENFNSSLENSRNCLRRIARNDDKEFSHQSILNVMETFVKTVNTMDETILVPCRLMDLKVGDENDPSLAENQKKHGKKETVQDLLNATDLFEIYNMLNSVKDGLLWGGESTNVAEPTASVAAVNAAPAKKGHVRRPSTVSVTSTNSSASTISDSESDAGSTNENDSGIEESTQEFVEESTQKVATDFRRHLHGLTKSLKQMTEAAHYLTWRYQHDIGGPV